MTTKWANEPAPEAGLTYDDARAAAEQAIDNKVAQSRIPSDTDVGAVPAATAMLVEAAWGTVLTAGASKAADAGPSALLPSPDAGSKYEVLEWRVTNYGTTLDPTYPAAVWFLRGGTIDFPVYVHPDGQPGQTVYTRRCISPSRPLFTSDMSVEVGDQEGLARLYAEIDYRVVPV